VAVEQSGWITAIVASCLITPNVRRPPLPIDLLGDSCKVMLILRTLGTVLFVIFAGPGWEKTSVGRDLCRVIVDISVEK
jgi:hypothetical protein